MTTELVFPLLVNIMVGIYMVWYYPRSVRKNFPDGRIPRGFAVLAKVIPVFGAALIFTSVIYGILSVSGVV